MKDKQYRIFRGTILVLTIGFLTWYSLGILPIVVFIIGVLIGSSL